MNEGWKVFPFDPRIRRNFGMCAVPFREGIAVFGGNSPDTSSMQIFTQKGEFIEEIKSSFIPLNMNQGSVVIKGSNIVAVTTKFQLDWTTQIFDGTKWSEY